MVKTRCEICDRNFKNEEALEMHNAAKHEANNKKESKPKLNIKKLKNWSIFIAVVLLIIWGISLLIPDIRNLPPTDMQGHVEANPDSHISKEPMQLLVQKHMLEHSDGTGPPGIIINYNCKDFECDPELIEKLEAFAIKYTANVYVAPFKNMGAIIVLTKLGRLEILEEYDEEKINNFIIGR